MSMIQALGSVSKVRGALIFVDNLDLALRRLDGAGFRKEDVVATKWGRFCFFWDPEGNPLQFYESAFVRPDADPERIPGS